ncbi:hypothetical protein ACP70R_026887 [Stipagrostis hirtigluma subsp. patula]
MAARRRSGGGEDYPSLMAWRLRLRRMLCFLKHHGLNDSALELERETAVFFDADYMEHLMSVGSWAKADDYLQRFLPAPSHTSPQSMRLVLHLLSAWTLAAVAAVAPTPQSSPPPSTKNTCSRDPTSATSARSSTKCTPTNAGASMLWKKVAPSAVDMALDMIDECPELKGKLHLPRDRPMPWEVTPLIGARGSRRRRSKAAERTPPDVVIRAFKRQRLLSVQETSSASGVPTNASSSSTLPTETEQIAPRPIVSGEQPMENVETALEKQDVAQL